MKQVLIHMKPEALDLVKNLELNWRYSIDEIDVIVPDVPYTVEDGIYEDPDIQLCEHYGIDYDLVNCIESC